LRRKGKRAFWSWADFSAYICTCTYETLVCCCLSW